MASNKNGAALGIFFTVIALGFWFALLLELLNDNTLPALIGVITLVVFLVVVLLAHKGYR
jgi:hypothetical protein